MVVDAEQLVHQIIDRVLRGFAFDQRGVELIACHSAEAAREAIKEHPDTAVIVLDEAMESDDAGIALVRYVRDELQNHRVRIVLRTALPGEPRDSGNIEQGNSDDMPAQTAQTALTSDKLLSTLRVAVRAYRDIAHAEHVVLPNDAAENAAAGRARVDDASPPGLGSPDGLSRLPRWRKSRLGEARRIARIGSWEYNPGDASLRCSDQVYRILRINRRSGKMTLDAFIGSFLAVDRRPLSDAINDVVEHGRPFSLQSRLILPDGQIGHVHHQGQLDRSRHDGGCRVIGTVQDVTAQIEAGYAVRGLSQRIEQSADAVVITDVNGAIEYVNAVFERMTGYDKEEVIGRDAAILKAEGLGSEFYSNLWRTVCRGHVFSDVIASRRKDGSLFYAETTIVPQRNRSGEITHCIVSGRDLGGRVESDQYTRHLAQHDGLTGLPNRAFFQSCVERAMVRAPARSHSLAVLLLDLDRFRLVNDTLGHSSGDQLLALAAGRILGCVRDGDRVARWGDDEFAIMLSDRSQRDGVDRIAQQLLTVLNAPFSIDQHELFMTASIGIARFPGDGDSARELLNNADTAMCCAKTRGKNSYQFFARNADAKADGCVRLERRLRQALAREEFRIYLQPQIDLETARVYGAEALLRWSLPDLGNIAPMRFIPMLEQQGLLVPVGEWVLHEACRSEKQRQNDGLEPRTIAVNLSSRQVHQDGFVKTLARTLDHTGLDPGYLELEIPERLLSDQIDLVARIMGAIYELGVRISIDNFGTGHASLNVLKDLPFDTLKMDRSLVCDMARDNDDAASTATIVSLAQLFDRDVVAVGVESVEQLEFLGERGCNKVQGHLFCRPAPANELDRFVAEHHASWAALAGGSE